MDKNPKCADVEERGSPEKRRRVPPARRAKQAKQQAPRQGGKSSCGAEGTSGTSTVEVVKVGSAGAASPDLDEVQQEPTVSLKCNPGETTNEDAAPLARQTTSNRLREESQMGEIIEIKEEEEEDLTAIAALASKRIRFEVEVKKQELKNLKVQKQEAVNQVKKISAELEAVHESTEHQKGLLKQHKGEEKSYKEQAEAYQIEIEALCRKLMDALKLKDEKSLLAKDDEAAISMSKEKGTMLERQLDEAKLKVEKVEKEIADLPSAPGYSPDMLSLLDNQIAAKRRELECPVCFEECATPIYTCNAQHLVCAKCRFRLRQCGICRIPYQDQLRHRYAEKDHQQLMDLCRQRDSLRQKLPKRGHI